MESVKEREEATKIEKKGRMKMCRGRGDEEGEEGSV